MRIKDYLAGPILILAFFLQPVSGPSNVVPEALTITQSGTTTVVSTYTVTTQASVSTQTTRQMITATGTVAQETFDPLCRQLTPPCMIPSFLLPVLVAETAIHVLATDDAVLKEQLASTMGLRVKVSGYVQPFNSSMRFAGYRCSPYTCGNLNDEISVTAIEMMANTTRIGTTTYTNSTSTTPPRTGCLLATAAFGSRLSPEVEMLRSFRDYTVMSQTAGSQFMLAFNSWYYSFSPYFSDYLHTSAPAREIMKPLLYPLIEIMRVSNFVIDQAARQVEGVVLSGFVASSLIGAIYLSPVLLTSLRGRRAESLLKLSVCVLGISSVALLIAAVVGTDAVLMFFSVVFALSSMTTGAVIVTCVFGRLTSSSPSRRLLE